MNVETIPVVRFQLGLIYITPTALEKLSQEDISKAIQRHQAGDWGDVSKDDRKENDLSLEKGFRLVSIYRTKSGVKFYIITEANRSATTVLLPGDY